MSSAWILDFATFPLREDLRLQAAVWLNSALSHDPEVSRDAYRSVGSAEFLRLSWRVDWLYRVSIVLGVVIFSLLIPRRAKGGTKANLLTVVCMGFVIARMSGALHHLSWPELSGVLLAGLMAAVLLMRVRKTGPNTPV